MSPTPGYGPVVSKCNFLDAAYAAAQALSPITGGCAATNAALIPKILIYRGGTAAAENPTLEDLKEVQFLVDIVNNCR
jgi:hypothetical protein